MENKIILNNKHGDFYDLHYTSPHYCTKYINWFTLPADKIVLKHFFTKTLEEWISKFNPENDINKKTEKIEYLLKNVLFFLLFTLFLLRF